MAGEPARKSATYEDIAALPSNVVGEILFGTLHVSPRPASPHGSASSALQEELGPPFKRGRGGPGGWVILSEQEVHLGADVLVPDLAGWRRERLPERPETPAFTLAPDWVAEVLSPSTAARDRVQKMAIYAREGVAHVWLVDPLERTLEVYELAGTAWTRVHAFAGDERVRAAPFEAIELDLAVLWAW